MLAQKFLSRVAEFYGVVTLLSSTRNIGTSINILLSLSLLRLLINSVDVSLIKN